MLFGILFCNSMGIVAEAGLGLALDPILVPSNVVAISAEVLQEMSASSAGRKFEGMEVDDEGAPNVPGPFEGASGRVDDVKEMPKQKQHKCEMCDGSYVHWDHFAYCDKSGKLVEHQDSVLSQVKQKVTGDGFCNLADGFTEELFLVCVICCEKMTKEKYTVKKGEGFTVTSAWKTLARRTKPKMKMPNKKLQNAMQTMEDRINRDGAVEGKSAVDIKEVYTLTESSLARQAADWVCELALNLTILYGCIGCGVYPLMSSQWWRCNSQINKEDGTVHDGHWRCAGCLKRFAGSSGWSKRLLAIGDEQQYFYFHLGSTSTMVEAKIRFLQLCQMLTVLDGKLVTKETLYECIRTLNERTQRRLSSFKEVVTLVAKDPAECNVQIFCSDTRLYLSAPGQRFKALDLNGETIEVLDEEGQNGVLDFAFGLTDWKEKWPTEPSLRKAYWDVDKSKATADSRAALLAIMSRL